MNPNYSLAVFIGVVVANVVGLAFDAVLLIAGIRTITERVWVHPWLGVPLVVLQAVGVAALALHFYDREK